MLTPTRAIVLASSLLLSAFASQASASDFQARYDKDSCAMPEYPAPWRTEEQQGDVKLELLVGADGNVVDAKLLESSGYSTLDKASLRASVKCKFKPVAKNGEMAQGWVKVQYVWVIN